MTQLQALSSIDNNTLYLFWPLLLSESINLMIHSK